MPTIKQIRTLPVFLLAAAALPLHGAGVPVAKPEDVGMSTERLRRVHEMVQRYIDAHQLSGAVTLVARKGRIAHFEAHGLMDLEAKKPMAKDAIFRLASMTKPVNAVAVLMLVEEGKIRLADPVSKYIPEFKDTKVAIARGGGGRGAPGAAPEIYTVPADREVTVRDMLTHTSGLGSGGPAARETQRLAARQPGDTLATYIPKLGAVPLDFQPGTQWAYSGSMAPDVLSRIVEIASGQPYDVFLRTRIFEPLGMKDTGFYPYDTQAARIPVLYQRNTLQKAPNQNGFANKTYFSGGAGLHSTAEDYLQFAQMLVNGGVLNGKRLLGPRTIELMASNHVGDLFNGKLGRPARGMGFGFQVAVIQDAVAAGLRLSNGSFGWDGAFGTQTWIDPKEKMVSIIMIQEQMVPVLRDFENAVMQAIIE